MYAMPVAHAILKKYFAKKEAAANAPKPVDLQTR